MDEEASNAVTIVNPDRVEGHSKQTIALGDRRFPPTRRNDRSVPVSGVDIIVGLVVIIDNEIAALVLCLQKIDGESSRYLKNSATLPPALGHNSDRSSTVERH